MDRKKLLIVALVAAGIAAMFAVGGIALAQDGPTWLSMATQTAAEPAPSEYWDAFKKIITDFRTVGVLAGLAAIVSFLLLVFRFKKLDDWLTGLDIKWIKPLVGASLTGILAMLTSVIGGLGWPEAIAAGLSAGIAAFSAGGIHQTVTKGNKKKVTG